MQKEKWTQWIGLGLVAALGLAAFLQLLDRFYPRRAANIRLARHQAMAVADAFLYELDLDVSPYQRTAVLMYNEEAFLYLQRQLGLATAQDWLRYRRHMGLNFCWEVQYFEDLPRSAPQHRLVVGVTGTGDIAYFQHALPADAVWPRPGGAHLSPHEASERLRRFLADREVDLTDFSEPDSTSLRRTQWTEHQFTWQRETEPTGCTVTLRAGVSGDELTLFRFQFNIPAEASLALKRQASNEYFLDTVVSIFVLFLIGLVTLLIFLKKYHEGEVEVRSGSVVFMLLWGVFILQALLRFQVNASTFTIGEMTRNGVALFIFILMVLIIRPLLSLFGFTSWSVGEALGRAGQSHKFKAVDALLNKRFFALDLAQSLAHGYLAGAVLLGLVAVAQTVAIEAGGAVTPIGGFQTLLPSPLPLLLPVLVALWAALLGELVFRLFGNLWLKQRLGKKGLAVVVTALFWTFYAPGFWDLHLGLYPMGLGLAVSFLIGCFLALLFWRYDLLTVIVANFTVMGVMQALPLLSSDSSKLWVAGLLSLSLLLSPLAVMVIGFIRRERFEIRVERMPAHIRRITERVRMSKELEIARQVQMRLLPKESPLVDGFEIKGGCIPAMEVGGDYYDFIELGPRRLGIVIGDVSGKGVPAAIYMTLTKGIVQSHQEGLSPREVLIRVNSMLYKAIDKETFVSLFYAVLDTERRELVYARAGHNPLIYFDTRVGHCRLLEPCGIALGLEEGRRFSEVIEEQSITLAEGDLLAFYTDGFTEAMNASREEYGETRLVDLIEAHHQETAEQLYATVLKDVRRFVKDAPQHDDMTLLFVKGNGVPSGPAPDPVTKEESHAKP